MMSGTTTVPRRLRRTTSAARLRITITPRRLLQTITACRSTSHLNRTRAIMISTWRMTPRRPNRSRTQRRRSITLTTQISQTLMHSRDNVSYCSSLFLFGFTLPIHKCLTLQFLPANRQRAVVCGSSMLAARVCTCAVSSSVSMTRASVASDGKNVERKE